MSLTYTTFTNQLANLMAADSTTTEFTTFLPGCIDYAEQRIYRELDLLTTVVRDSSGSCTASSRVFVLPTSTYNFVTVQGVNVITPVGQTNPDASTATRNLCLPVSRDYIDAVWNSSSGKTVPTMFAVLNQPYSGSTASLTIILAPWPDNTYNVEIVGTIRPTALSIGNTTTFLTTYLPDLFMAAAMVFASGYMRNFGSQADTPQMSQSWETQYQTLKASTNIEELRRKYASLGWTSRSEAAPAPER